MRTVYAVLIVAQVLTLFAAAYAALELEILGAVGYGLISCTAREASPEATAMA